MLVTPESVVMVDWAPLFWLKVTVWPGIGVPEPSSRVTVMVEEALPLSATEMGLATTLEFVWETVPAPDPKVTLG